MLKRIYLLFTFLLVGFLAKAQDFEIVGIEHLPNDFSARKEIKIDPEGRQCALLRIATRNITTEQREGFSFMPDQGAYIVERAIRDGEIWLWVSPKLKHLRVKHRFWGQVELHMLDYVSIVESLHVYKIVINGMLSGPVNPTQQYLAFQITPPNAHLEVDGNSWEVDPDGSASQIVEFGTYNYHVAAKGYFSKDDSVTVNDPDSTKVVVVNLKPNFARVTLQVNADAEIWVGNEKKGIRSWTGILDSGNYRIECRQANHETSVTIHKITPEMEGQTITLSVPIPIYGSINVVSTPKFAKIYLDGEYMGETPRLINNVLIGRHELRLEKENYAPLVDSIVVEKNVTNNIDKKMDDGRTVTIKSDREGDMIYVDGEYKGMTPKEVFLRLGKHTVRVKRGEKEEKKQVVITLNTPNKQELLFEFGKIVTIKTGKKGDQIFINDEFIDSSPLTVYLDFGEYHVCAKRNDQSATMDIKVSDQSDDFEYTLEFSKPSQKISPNISNESAWDYVSKGVGFVTLNAATSCRDFRQPVKPLYGFGIGTHSGYGIGLFLTSICNFNFDAMNAPLTCDNQGLVDGEYPEYTGNASDFRLSVLGGFLFSGSGVFGLRLGIGYGMRTKCLAISDGTLVKVANNCFSGVDLIAGFQFNLKGFTLSLDAVTSTIIKEEPMLTTPEIMIGLGYCWRHKR